jgi:hypothetical protein
MPVMSFSSLVSQLAALIPRPAAQNRDAIRELENFFEPVRNIDNGNTFGLETTYQREELCGFLRVR